MTIKVGHIYQDEYSTYLVLAIDNGLVYTSEQYPNSIYGLDRFELKFLTSANPIEVIYD